MGRSSSVIPASDELVSGRTKWTTLGGGRTFSRAQGGLGKRHTWTAAVRCSFWSRTPRAVRKRRRFAVGVPCGGGWILCTESRRRDGDGIWRKTCICLTPSCPTEGGVVAGKGWVGALTKNCDELKSERRQFPHGNQTDKHEPNHHMPHIHLISMPISLNENGKLK